MLNKPQLIFALQCSDDSNLLKNKKKFLKTTRITTSFFNHFLITFLLKSL